MPVSSVMLLVYEWRTPAWHKRVLQALGFALLPGRADYYDLPGDGTPRNDCISTGKSIGLAVYVVYLNSYLEDAGRQ